MKPQKANRVEQGPARICAIFPGALGDFICFLPALRILRRRRVVDLYARREFTGLVPDEISIRSLESGEVSHLFQPPSAARDRVLEHWRKYDAIYSWHGSGNPQVMLRLRQFASVPPRFFPFRPPSPLQHQARYYSSCVGTDANDLEAATERVPIPVQEDARRWTERFWIEHALGDRPVLAMAAGSGAREKNWPAEFYVEVAEWWRGATGGEVLLLIGPVERERGGLGRLPAVSISCGELSLAQVAATLARSLVFIGNDSGISHLAGALGIRAMTLFGPTDPLQWSPRGEKVIVLRRGLDCSPCSDAIMKHCPHRSCLNDLRPPEIIAALRSLPEVVTLTR